MDEIKNNAGAKRASLRPDVRREVAKLEREIRSRLSGEIMTVRQLSQATGVSTAHLTDIKKANPKKMAGFELILRLADYYQIPYQFLAGEIPKK